MIQRGLHSEYIGFISPLFNAMVTFNFRLFESWEENIRELSVAVILSLLSMNSAGSPHL